MTENRLETKLKISKRILYNLSVERLEVLAEDIKKLKDLPHSPGANRRVIYVGLLSNKKSFDGRFYSSVEYRGNVSIREKNYTAQQISRL